MQIYLVQAKKTEICIQVICLIRDLDMKKKEYIKTERTKHKVLMFQPN